jgi:hypothetical protein
LFSGLADATANVFARLAQGDILGAVAAGISGIANAIGSLFGDKEQEQVNDMRDAFLDLQGGFVSLQEKLLAITDQDLVKRVFDAKTVDEFNAAVAEVNRLFDLQAQAEEKLIEAMDRYGLTIEEMGPKWAQQELNKMAMQLFEDYELLTAAGADHNAVLAKMAPSMQEYVNTAIKAGSTIPESLRPVIQAMIDQGLLLDENGVAFTSLEDAGLSFAESLEAGLGRTIDAIKELVRTLQRLYSLGPPDIPAPPPPGGGGGHGGGGHGHAAGWARITDWGVPAMLHGTPSNPEYVLRGNQLGEVVDAAVDRAVRAAMRGGGGGRTVIENRIFLGGQELRDWLSRQRTAGYIE